MPYNLKPGLYPSPTDLMQRFQGYGANGSYGANDNYPSLMPSIEPPSPLGKAALDGTYSFGANSAPNAWADFSSIASGPSAAASGGYGSSIKAWLKESGFLGTKEDPGWGSPAMGIAGGMANLFMGMKQYGLAKDTLAENKRQFELNYNAQRNTTNAAMEGRQAGLVGSSTPGTYQSVNDYMTKYGVK